VISERPPRSGLQENSRHLAAEAARRSERDQRGKKIGKYEVSEAELPP
jgi:hypothetical protein